LLPKGQSFIHISPPNLVKSNVDNLVLEVDQRVQWRIGTGHPTGLVAVVCVAGASRQCHGDVAPTMTIFGDDGIDDFARFAFQMLEPTLLANSMYDNRANPFDWLASDNRSGLSWHY
jgi:hypothetical protein